MAQREGSAVDAGRRAVATGVGCVAVGLWSALATLTTFAGGSPPFQLIAMAFGVGSAPGLVALAREPGMLRRVPPGAWLLGIGGLFGYHFLYFVALRHAPAAQASLIAYLWPLLIVVFSALLPTERLRWWHVAGATLGLAGTATLLLGRGGDGGVTSAYALGYLCAVGCALVWSTYSVGNRRYAGVPTPVVSAFCVVTAALALCAHLALEQTVWPTGWQWAAVALLGAGPLGAAFYAWDYGTKHGDLRMLGTLSYLAPLLSTVLLLAAGRANATWGLLAACVLITGGALLAARGIPRRRSTPATQPSPRARAVQPTVD